MKKRRDSRQKFSVESKKNMICVKYDSNLWDEEKKGIFGNLVYTTKKSKIESIGSPGGYGYVP